MNENKAEDGTDSKRLLGRMGLGALALGAMSAFGARRARAATITDADVLNFALNLEYLEAEYYLRAVTGAGIPAGLTGGSSNNVIAPATTLVPFSNPAIAYWAQAIASEELSHVNFLREGIAGEGGTPVAEPAIDLVNSFNTLAQAAGLGASFNPFENEVTFMVGAYIFEDVGVTAYGGAAALLTNPVNISYGASILAVEAEHAGCIRAYLASQGGGAATNAISALRQTLSGVQDNGTDLSASGGNPFSFANNDYNGQTFRRTPQEVLNVVYGAPGTGVTKGLFYPSGMNGLVTSS